MAHTRDDAYQLFFTGQQAYNPVSQQARQFPTGATRSDDTLKPDYEGYLSPLVIERFGQYMLQHSYAGQRTSDNWQKGIPQAAYIKSAWRHFLVWWAGHRGQTTLDIEEALCGLLFNTMGYLHERLKAKQCSPPAA